MNTYARVRRRRPVVALVVVALLAAGFFVTRQPNAKASVDVVRSTFQGRDGKQYWVTNHLVRAAAAPLAPTAAPAASGSGYGTGHEYLLVWAGDRNAGDTTGNEIQRTPLAVNPVQVLNEKAVD